MKMNKVLLCCIGRRENQYIREFVEYYKNLGFDNICLYDNNYDGEDRFEDAIGDYIDNGYVFLKDYRNRSVCQLQAYQECYDNYKDEYDWIAFFDIDEFLSLVNDNDIHTFLSHERFDGYDVIAVNWKIYGDSDIVMNDGRGVLDRFQIPVPNDRCVAYNFPENNHIKAIVRTGKPMKWGYSVHCPNVDEGQKVCDPSGCAVSLFATAVNPKADFTQAFIRHYSTKTIEENCQKMKRGFPDGKWDENDKLLMERHLRTRFFRYNTPTREKIDVVKDILGIDMSYLLKEKNKDVQIFNLCYTYKGFMPIEDSVITPIQVGAAGNFVRICDKLDNEGDNISGANYFYVENTGTYWIWKNVKDAKYKGQMQYRRPLEGVNDTMDFDDIFSKYDVITCKPFHHPDHKTPTKEEPMVIPADTVEQGYAFSNCADDLYLCEFAVKTIHPDYAADWDKYIKNGADLYYSNGFVMRAEDFDRYADFLFSSLNAYLAFANVHTPDELYKHVSYNMQVGKYVRYQGMKEIPQEAIKWQMLIGGFLSERLWTLWLLHNFSKDRILEREYIKMEPEKMYT